MIERLKKIFIININSINKKLILYFIVMLIMFGSISFYTYLSGKTLNDLYNSALEKHLELNDLFINLGDTNQILEKYLQSGSTQEFNRYSKAYPKLQESASNLESIVNNNTYVRETLDLKYMVQSYLEEANTSIKFKQDGNLKESNVHYYEAQNIYKLINENFKSVYSIILKDTNNLKIEVMDTKKKVYAYNGILIASVVFIGLLFTRWFSMSLTRPLKKLTVAASRVSKGEISEVETQINTFDEMNILSLAFNKMVKKIDEQISEIKDNAELEKTLKEEEMENLKIKNLLKESELRSLQSRINPHFLFNTLNMISQMSYLEEAVQTSTLLEAMTELLRYNLDNFSKVVRLEEEINNVKDYIFIQKKRFGERINFEIKQTEGTGNVRIPCLIIQPLVENSILHGVNSYTKHGIIKVNVNVENNRIIIRVYDNGVGMDKNKLDNLNKMLHENKESDEAEGIGLNNVFSRLKLFCNNDVDFNIKSDPVFGTEIEISIHI